MSDHTEQRRTEFLTGFGGGQGATCYSNSAQNSKDIKQVLSHVLGSKEQLSLRGAGQSYGDSATLAEQQLLYFLGSDIEWTSENSAWVDAGCNLRKLCEACLLKGLWPKVVTGTSRPTIGGLVAANAHGKNAFRVGTFGDSILAIEMILASGELIEVEPNDELFWAICGSMGLLGIITKVHLKFAEAAAGSVIVEPVILPQTSDCFRFFAESMDHDYAVAWLDMANSDRIRGLGHRAVYSDQSRSPEITFAEPSQFKSKIAPKLKFLISKTGIGLLNKLKYTSSIKKSGTKHTESLPNFNFLLDAIPGWEKIYAPCGMVQIQVFIPEANSQNTFDEIHHIMQEQQIFTNLAVMKRHFESPSLLNPGLNGFSLAMDFLAQRENPNWVRMVEEIHETALINGGRFYLAKDLLLNPETWKSSLPEGNLERFRAFKKSLDPNGLFSSDQAKRLKIFSD